MNVKRCASLFRMGVNNRHGQGLLPALCPVRYLVEERIVHQCLSFSGLPKHMVTALEHVFVGIDISGCGFMQKLEDGHLALRSIRTVIEYIEVDQVAHAMREVLYAY